MLKAGFTVAGARAMLASAALAKAPALPPALDQAVTQSHEALRRILNGDPSGCRADR